MAITPLSQLFNTLLFAFYSLLTHSFTTILFQGALVSFSLLFFRKNVRGVRVRAFIPILPVLVFVFTVNCVRGYGEVMLRLGIFVLVRQGIQRGLYYVLVIVFLFIMSRLLTHGFAQEELFNSLYSLARFFGKLKLPGRRSCPGGWIARRPADDTAGVARGIAHGIAASEAARPDDPCPPAVVTFLLVLFSVLRMFQVAYAEMKLFFKKGERSLKQRVIDYFYAVYGKSMEEFDGIETSSWRTVRFLPFDYLYVSLQVALLVASSVLRIPGAWW